MDYAYFSRCRKEVGAINRLEKRLVQTTDTQASTSTGPSDAREAALATFSDAEEEPELSVAVAPPLPIGRATTSSSADGAEGAEMPPIAADSAPRVKAARKRSLMDLVRDNQIKYNRFLTKKVPKLLRQLGVSSDESD